MNEKELEIKRSYAVMKRNEIVQKATYNMTALEQKFLCYVISKIKPTDKELDFMIISALEFAEVCGIDKKNVYREFKKMADDFRHNQSWVKIGDDIVQLGIIGFPEYNEKSGRLKFILNPRLKKYLLEMGNHYTRYELWNILSLKSKHSIRLYELFRSYAYQFEVEIELEKLKALLCVSNYKLFKDFERRVLNPGIEEINSLTDLEVSCTPIRYGKGTRGKGSKVISIVFNIKRKDYDGKIKAYYKTVERLNKDTEQCKGQITMFDEDMKNEIKSADEISVT